MKKYFLIILMMIFMIGFVSAEYSLEVYADSINEGELEINGVLAWDLGGGKFKLNNSNTNYEIARAKIMQTLFYNAKSISGLTNPTKIISTDERDQFGRGMSATIADTLSVSGSKTYSGVFQDTDNDNTCSSWSIIGGTGESSSNRYWSLNGTVLHQLTTPTSSSELGTNLTDDERTNPLTSALYLSSGGAGNLGSVTAILLCRGNITWTASGSRNGVTTTNIDFKEDNSIPIFSWYSDDLIDGKGVLLGGSSNFNINVTEPEGLSNISLYINDILNETFDVGGTENSSSFTKTFSQIGDKIIKIEVCDISGDCFDTGNHTYTVQNMEFVSDSFIPSSTEGNLQTFYMNITTNYQVSTARLFYDGTFYDGAFTKVNDSFYKLDTSIVTPTVSADENKTFYWSVTLANSEEYNDTAQEQTVQNIGIDDCSSNTLLVANFSLVDEELGTLLSTGNDSIDLTFLIYSSDLSNLIINYSKQYSSNTAAVCLGAGTLDSSSYALSAAVQYNAQDYATEFYNIQNFTLNNDTAGFLVNLYDLKSSDSTEFQITVKDNSFLPIVGALVQINRQFTGEGVFKTVEIPVTDANGQTVAHLVKNDALYNFVITRNGTTLATFSNLKAFCEDTLSQSCFITLNSRDPNPPIFDYDASLGIEYSLNYNESSRLLSMDFVVATGATANVTMIARKLDNLGNTTACEVSLVSSSGTIQCTIPASIGNATLEVEVKVDGVTKAYDYIVSSRAIDLGVAGPFLMFVLVLSLVMLSLESKTMVVLSTAFGVVGSILLYFIRGGILGKGSAVMWLVIAVLILLNKLNKDGQT